MKVDEIGWLESIMTQLVETKSRLLNESEEAYNNVSHPLESASSQLYDFYTQYKSQSTELEELKAENETLQSAFDNNYKEFMLLGTHAKDLEKERDELKAEIGIDWKEEYDQAVNEIGQLQDRLKEAEDEIRDLNRR
jgi:chromosome segregation ATPase